MNFKKIIFYFFIITFLTLIVYFGIFTAKQKYTWSKAANAVGGYPYQIGLTNAVIIPCVTSGTPPVCVGGTLCMTLDAARCNLYSDVSGMPAGGMGNMALFLNSSLAAAGVVSGGQLIAGGAMMTMMDGGVLAGAGGCFGCY